MNKKEQKILENYIKNSKGMRISVNDVTFEVEFENKKKKISTDLEFTYCMLPGGLDGYRIELFNKNDSYTEIGTLVYSPIEKKWKVIQW